MRASDADRDAVLSDLSANFQAGRLTPEELEDRTGRALAARTWGELKDLLRDLPSTLPGPQARVAAPSSAAQPGRPSGRGRPLRSPCWRPSGSPSACRPGSPTVAGASCGSCSGCSSCAACHHCADRGCKNRGRDRCSHLRDAEPACVAMNKGQNGGDARPGRDRVRSRSFSAGPRSSRRLDNRVTD